MTLEEYDIKVDELREKGDIDALNELKISYMTEIMSKMYAKAEAYKNIAKSINYLIDESFSGSVINYAETKEKAELIQELSLKELDDYMLDTPDIYQDDIGWTISYMFGGNYVPYWDGDDEED